MDVDTPLLQRCFKVWIILESKFSYYSIRNLHPTILLVRKKLTLHSAWQLSVDTLDKLFVTIFLKGSHHHNIQYWCQNCASYIRMAAPI